MKSKLSDKSLVVLILTTIVISFFFLYLITTSLYMNYKKLIDILSMINLVVLFTALIYRGQISIGSRKRKHDRE